MTKEYLEALEKVGNNLEHHYPENIKDFNILQQALQRLEAIDNANPSEALECLENLCDEFPILKKDYKIINRALLKSQEQEKVLEIIKEKGVDVGYLKTCKTLEEYNSNCWNDDEDFNKKITQEEFDLLKRG